MRFFSLSNFVYLSLRILKSLDKRRTGIEDFRPEAVQSILLVACTAIGDTLLSTPAIRAVRKRYPKARIIAFFNSKNEELFSNNPNIDGVISYYGGWKRFFSTIKALRKHSFDLALILHGNEPQATPLCYLSGARFILKIPNDNRFNFLLSNREALVRRGELGHGILTRLQTAALAGCPEDGVRMELFFEKRDLLGADAFLASTDTRAKGDILVGFQPGASTVSRQWFPERFIELGKKILSTHPEYRIILTGSPSERALCENIKTKIGQRAFVAAGSLPLREAAALIKRLNVLVTGDTGPMHIAITVGTPVVALYAAADSACSGPLYDTKRHRVIKKEKTCEPCISRRCRYQECMEQITVDEVFEAVVDILEK
ncbi:MAG: glycosyltransferase family 9 protein [Thermodesulfobacteriota bacterium]